MLKNRTVVLGTGSGFIGKKICERLKAGGSEVLAVSSKEIDLCASDSVDRLKKIIRTEDAVVFASAITPDKGKDAATFMKNVTMSVNVATAIEQTPCAYFIYISSDAVYADTINPVREDAPCDSGGLYGHMHRARELVLKPSLQKSKIPHLFLRPTAVYGFGDTHNGYGPNRFLRTGLKQKKISLFGGGEEKRDHIHVDDFCRIVELSLQNKREGILNAATGISISFFDLAKNIAEMVGDGVSVETSARANPITYRHFDVTAVYRAFPEFKFTDLHSGLSDFLRKEKNV